LLLNSNELLKQNVSRWLLTNADDRCRMML
jgi:hypothetical protein